MDRFDCCAALGMDAGFHFHRFDGQQQIALIDFLAHRNGNRSDNSGHRGTDVIWIAQFRLGPRCGLGFDQAIGHADHARLTIEFKENFHLAVFIGFPNSLQAYFKYFTRIDFSCDFFTWLHAVKNVFVGKARTGP